MKIEVTQDVVSDLWSLCQSGDASADSRALVDTFLAEETGFAQTLRESQGLDRVMPSFRLSPDAERRLLEDARQRARTKLLVIGGAIALVGVLALVALGGLLFFMSSAV